MCGNVWKNAPLTDGVPEENERRDAAGNGPRQRHGPQHPRAAATGDAGGQV